MKVFNFNSMAADGRKYEAPEVEVVRVVSENAFCSNGSASCDEPDDFTYGGSL